MNTLVQDERIPIYITLQYGKNLMKFPINPEDLPKEIPSASETVEIEGIGEVGIPCKPGLAKISISSFFWHQWNMIPSSTYVAWLEKWQKSGKPATLLVTRLNYSMKVTCESFKHYIKAGEEKDVYFELELQEYREYGARYLNKPNNSSLLQKVQDMAGLATPPVLIEIPRPARGTTLKDVVSNVFKVIPKYNTLCAITKKLTGSTAKWKELYDENKKMLGDIFTDGESIPSGSELRVPDGWRGQNGLSMIEA